MLSEKMEAALNTQMNKEFYSAYLYLSMAAYSQFVGLKGAANWFNVQVQEEMLHFNKFFAYVLDSGAKVKLMAIAKPPVEFKSLKDIFEQTLKHEKFVTQCIHGLVDLARQGKDHPTETFLQWFVTEQVEEEANANSVLARVKLAGEQGLFLVDNELAARVFTPPAAAAAAGAP